MKKENKTKLKKNRNVFSGFLYLLEKNHDRFLLIFVIVVVLNVFSLLIFRGTESICGLVSTSKGLLESKIRNESVDHFVAVQKVVKSVEERIFEIEQKLDWSQENFALKDENRLKLLKQLQRLDEISYDLQWVEHEYFTDYSIQYYPYSTGCLSSYVYETRHLKRAIDRFVDVSETALMLNSIEKKQSEIVAGELNEIKAYLENLKQFKQDLRLLGDNTCDEKGIHKRENL